MGIAAGYSYIHPTLGTYTVLGKSVTKYKIQWTAGPNAAKTTYGPGIDYVGHAQMEKSIASGKHAPNKPAKPAPAPGGPATPQVGATYQGPQGTYLVMGKAKTQYKIQYLDGPGAAKTTHGPGVAWVSHASLDNAVASGKHAPKADPSGQAPKAEALKPATGGLKAEHLVPGTSFKIGGNDWTVTSVNPDGWMVTLTSSTGARTYASTQSLIDEHANGMLTEIKTPKATKAEAPKATPPVTALISPTGAKYAVVKHYPDGSLDMMNPSGKLINMTKADIEIFTGEHGWKVDHGAPDASPAAPKVSAPTPHTGPLTAAHLTPGTTLSMGPSGYTVESVDHKAGKVTLKSVGEGGTTITEPINDVIQAHAMGFIKNVVVAPKAAAPAAPAHHTAPQVGAVYATPEGHQFTVVSKAATQYKVQWLTGPNASKTTHGPGVAWVAHASLDKSIASGKHGIVSEGGAPKAGAKAAPKPVASGPVAHTGPLTAEHITPGTTLTLGGTHYKVESVDHASGAVALKSTQADGPTIHEDVASLTAAHAVGMVKDVMVAPKAAALPAAAPKASTHPGVIVSATGEQWIVTKAHASGAIDAISPTGAEVKFSKHDLDSLAGDGWSVGHGVSSAPKPSPTANPNAAPAAAPVGHVPSAKVGQAFVAKDGTEYSIAADHGNYYEMTLHSGPGKGLTVLQNKALLDAAGHTPIANPNAAPAKAAPKPAQPASDKLTIGQKYQTGNGHIYEVVASSGDHYTTTMLTGPHAGSSATLPKSELHDKLAKGTQKPFDGPPTPGGHGGASLYKLPGDDQFADFSGLSGKPHDWYDRWTDWSNSLPAGQKQAVQHYTGQAAFSINKGLRGVATPPPPTKEWLTKMDAALNTARADRDVMVWRGAHMNDVSFKVGDHWSDPGYLSTSLSSPWSGDQFAIRVRKGQRMAYVDHISRNLGEDEVILPRDAKFRVLAVQMVGTKRMIHLEYLDPEEGGTP